MIKEELKNLIVQAIKTIALERNWSLPKDFDIPLVISEEKNYGDYSSTIALNLSKIIEQSPISLAELLAAEINKQQSVAIKKIEIAKPGYLNFFLTQHAFQKELPRLKDISSCRKIKHKSPVIVEYSSPNIAKPMHIGHLRSTIIGDALANLYQFLGYRTIRWNYLGDWGTQFGKLITAYKLWGNKKLVQQDPINNLLALYRKFHQEAKNNSDLETLAQEEFKKLEQGDKINRKIWSWFRAESLKEFYTIYHALEIKFDVIKGESDFEKDLAPLIKELKNKKLAQESQGALIIPLEKFGLPPALIQKADEASLYLTRDLANLIYRLKKYQPEQILYVVGNEQALYFEQLFTIAKLLNIAPNTQLEHIKFGLILDAEKKKFSTREGELITLNEVINKGLENSLAIIKEKHPQWPIAKQKQLARIIALGALKFNDLKSFRTSNIIFNWQQMLNFQGNSSVYLQYTYARFHKILSQAPKPQPYDENLLTQDLEIALIKELLEFETVIGKSTLEYSPHLLVTYLLSLADLLNKYYETIPVLKEANIKRRHSQLLLLQSANLILKQGLEILGISVVKEI